jgi:hypothetical protein
MKLTGIKTQEVDVDITPQEMIRGLYHECGLEMVYLVSKSNSSNRRWVLKELHETDDHKPIGISPELTVHQHPEQPVLIEEENLGIHGSDNFYPTGRKISDPRKIKALKLLTELEKVIEEFENE